MQTSKDAPVYAAPCAHPMTCGALTDVASWTTRLMRSSRSCPIVAARATTDSTNVTKKKTGRRSEGPLAVVI
jgi:hypothetical protein